MSSRRILVTPALPYANGPIHIGHLLEHIQTDIWVRFQRLRGHRVLYVCADDTHGTPIMMRARQEGRSEEEVIAEMRALHREDFEHFRIDFDHFSSTHSDANRKQCELIWQAMRDRDMIRRRPVEQLFDPQEEIFLADRFVKGTCPNCGASDQYGDSCDNCGATYAPTELVNPKSTLSGSTPEIRSCDHEFVELEPFHDFLEQWIAKGDHLQPEVANYLMGQFLSGPLRAWDVSRPAPYFGFEIPDFPGHFWYVWFDAPTGYIAATQEWCEIHGESLADWWQNPDVEIHHFIGKDITYFHTLFWPTMLHVAGFQLPKKVHVHGFIKVNGEKMSKSKGTFIEASTYRKHLDPSYLRYYYASRLSALNSDIDLSFDDFINRVNSDLLGKVVNLASRTARFLKGQPLAQPYPDDGGLFEYAASKREDIAGFYERGDTSLAMREIMLLADRANKFVEERAPWTLRKDPSKQEELLSVCSIALNLFRQIVTYLGPVLPKLKEQTEALLDTKIHHWDEVAVPLTGSVVQPFEHLMKRLDEAMVQKMVADSVREAPSSTPAPRFDDSREALDAEPLAETCTIDDFMKVDMRVARIIEANAVKESKKLIQLKLSLGGDETRQVFAGLQGVYEPESLIGRLVIFCANLAPRKMRFGTSEGMVLAAGPGGKDIFVLAPDSGAVPGQRVH